MAQPEFSADEYFNRRIQRANQNIALPVEAAPPVPAPDQTTWQQDAAAESLRVQDLQERSARNIEALNSLSQSRQARLSREKSTWAGQAREAGLDFLGIPEAADAVAQVYSGASTLLGQAESGIYAAQSAYILQSLPQGSIEARNRQMRGEDTEEDRALLNTSLGGRQTVGSQIQRAERLNLGSDDARRAWDRTSVASTARTDQVRASLESTYRANSKDLSEGWEKMTNGDRLGGASQLGKAVLELIKGTGTAAIDNPGGVADYMLQNSPQIAAALFGGTVGIGGTGVAYALDLVGQGIQEHRMKNGGDLPSFDQIDSIAQKAALAAGAEMLGDVAMVGGKAIKATGVGKVADAIFDSASNVVPKNATRGFKEALMEASSKATAPLASILKRTSEGVVGEGATEGLQTWLENSIKGDKTTGQDLYVGASIGAMVGGGMAGSISTADQAAKGVALAAEAGSKALVEREARQEAQKAAIDSGDVTPLVDPKSSSYDPAMAVDALSKNGQDNPDKFDDNLAQAQKIVSDLETRLNSQQGVRDSSTPEALQKSKEVLVELEQKLAMADKSDVSLVQSLTEEIKDQKAEIEDSEAEQGNTAQHDELLTKMSQQLEQAQARLTQFNQKNVQASDADADIEVAKGTDPVSATAAVDRVINLSMASESVLDSDTAEALSTNEAIPAPQRKWLGEFAKTQRSLNDVGDDVLNGTGGNVGIFQYRQRMANAIAANDQKQAERQLTSVAKFHALQHSKAVAAKNAFESKGQNTIVRGPDGLWMVGTGPGQVKVNGPKYYQSIERDAAALLQTRAELAAAYDLKFRPELTQVKAKEQKAVPAVSTPSVKPVDSTESKGVSYASTSFQGETEAVGSKAQKQSTEEGTRAPVEEQLDAGKLSAVSNKSPAGSSFRARNLIGDYFVQTAGKAGDSTSRPLVAVKDFLSQWEPGFDFSKYVKFPENSEQQQKAIKTLRTFYSYAKKWSGVIQKNLTLNKDSNYFYKNLAQYFITQEGDRLDMEENLKTAISYAAFSWAADAGTKSEFNTNEEINAILNREPGHFVSWKETEAFASIGARQTVVANSLGRAVVQALGLQPRANAPLELDSKLASTLGSYALKLMLDTGLAEQHVYNGQQMTELAGKPYPEKELHRFIKVNKEQAAPIAEAVKGSQSILDKMFKAEVGPKEPSLEPIPFEQKTTKNTNQRVPAKLAKILDGLNRQENFLRQDMWHLMEEGGLSHENWMAIAGAQDPVTKQITQQIGTQAKNDGLERELFNFQDWVKETIAPLGFETPFYFQHTAWKQQRVGIENNVVNPQTSKIHRRMIFKKGYESVVSLTDPTQMENFLLRVGEGLGVKTDKQGNEKSLAVIEAKLASPEIQAAVAALQKRLGDSSKLTAEDQDAIVLGVKAGGEAMHSMDSLVALAHYDQAKKENKDSFTTHLTGEVDGVTNGPMLSHLFYGAGSSPLGLISLLNRGGFYQVGNAYSNYNQWRGNSGEFDLYEVTAKNITQRVPKLIEKNPGIAPVLEAIYSFTGALTENGVVQKAGRNIVKTPLTAMVFGSSLRRSVESMADGFVESIYSQLTTSKTREAIASTIDNINLLLINGMNSKAPAFIKERLTLPQSLTEEDLMNLRLSDEQVKALKKSFTDTLGKAVETTMAEDFASFLTRTAQHNTAAQLAFDLYNAVYQAERSKLTAELVKSGDIEVSQNQKNPVPIHEMTVTQERELRNRLAPMAPLLHTAMSKDSNSLASALFMSKSERKLSQKNTFSSEIKFANKTPNGDERTNISGFEVVEQSPGVAMASMPIHSADSAISHRAADQREVLNIHDAHLSGLNLFTETAQALNRETYSVLMEYSPMSEMADALDRVLIGLAKAMQTATPEMKANVAEVIAKLSDRTEVDLKDALEQFVTSFRSTAAEADRVKLETLGILQAVDQYALEGGQYEVTDADRASAMAAVKELKLVPDAVITRAVEDITKAIFDPKGSPSEDLDLTTQPEDEIDTSVSEEVLSFGSTRGMQLLESITSDESLNQTQRNQAEKVLDAMRNGSNLRTAVLDAADVDQAASMVQLLAERYRAIPEHLWGGRGPSAIPSDPRLVKFFEENHSIKASRVLEGLKRLVSNMPDAQSVQRDFQLRLLSVLGRTVNPDLKVRYITPTTNPNTVLEAPGKNSRGWYVATPDGKEEVYILSPDFIHSGVQIETLMHELVHGALARTVASELAKKKANASYKSDALELVQELQSLMDQAEKLSGAKKSFPAAFANLDDFIAWGMTNVGFQKQVLNQVAGFKSTTQGNRLINGMKKFIEIVTGILFRKSTKGQQERDENGMAVLVANVSGLFAAAAEVKSPVETLLAKSQGVNLSHASVLQSYGTVDILSALDQGQHSAAFSDHLKNLMGSLVEKLHGPFGSFKESLMKDQAIGPMDVWLKALATGKAPFASEILANIALSEQEAFAVEQVEATVKAAIDSKDATVRAAYKQLEDLFVEASKKIKPQNFYKGDWNTATQVEKDTAQAKYDFIFNVKAQANNSNQSDYLSRFAAMGLANEDFLEVMNFVSDKKSRDVSSAKNFAERLQIIFEQILEFFAGKLSHTHTGMRGDAKLTALVDTLVDIEAKKRHKLARQQSQFNPIKPVEDAVKKGVEAVKDKVSDLAGSNAVRNSKSVYVRAAGSLARISVNDQVELFVDALKQIRDREFPGQKYGLLAGTLNDVKGPMEKFMALLRQTKYYEGQRKKLITQSGAMALNAFVNGGKDLTKEDKAAVTALFLRTGASHLLDGKFTTQDLEKLLTDNNAMQKAIADQEALLTGLNIPVGMKNYMRNQASATGYFRATDEVKSALLMMNAHNIANLYGTNYVGRLTEAETSAAEAILEPLIALYAIEASGSYDKTQAAKALAKENQRTDKGNGVEFVLKLHARMEKDSQGKLFQGNKVMMQHGYTPEIYNPHVELRVADDVEGKDLMAQGYSKGLSLVNDQADPDKTKKKLYVLRDGGLARYQTGAISYTSQAAKGTRQHNGFTGLHTQEGRENFLLTQGVTNDKAQAIAELFQGGPRKALSGVKSNFLAPVLNPQGEIVNYRYLMNGRTKDDILERTNDFDQILGVLEGSIYDKVMTTVQNEQVIKALYEDHEKHYAQKGAAFIEIGPRSKDPAMREVWKMLPKPTRDDVKRIWGGDSMSVRTDSLDLIFGYRKLSLAGMFQRDLKDNEYAQRIFRGFVETLLRMNARMRGGTPDEVNAAVQKAAVLVTRGERIWQEIVGEVKDIIVVKTGTVLWGNIWSNFSLLIASGVPMKDIATHHLVAMKAVTAYQEDETELAEIEEKLGLGYLAGADEQGLKNKAARLKDSLARNPVKELIDAGLMPTIVEDLASDEDPYSYKSELSRKADRFISKVPSGLLNAGRLVYMAHDTKLYQGLSRLTQLSDFVARYTLYQHLMNRQDSPLTKEQAVEQAGDAFINYDVPMHRTLQYTDDMGIIPFTKYFLRIQRVLVRLMRDNPARVMSMALLNNFMDLGPIILESSAWHRVPGNPLDLGALKYPSVLDDLATVSTGMALIK